MRRRVFIMGIGLVSPHGTDIDEVFERLYTGKSAIRKVRSGTAEHGTDALLAQVSFDPGRTISRTQSFTMDRVAQLAVVAAHDALSSASLLEDVTPPKPSPMGVYFGCGLGGSQALQDAYRVYWERHSRRLKPTTVPLIMANAPASHISMQYKMVGPTLTYSVACASSAIAIGEAFRAIRDGYIDSVLAGGAESMMNDGTIAAWEMLGVLAKEHPDGPEASSRPFSADRTGFVLGEGAAALVLECEESARRRGAQPLAEIVGYGSASDGHNLTQPFMDGQVRAMQFALSDAGLSGDEIGYINAHATGTPAGDTVEIDAIKQTFGAHAHALAVSATKSMHGHLVGAAGALECAITALVLLKQRIPPTAFLTQQDPACDLDCVPCAGRNAGDLRYALSNSFAFGGSNAALIIKRI